MRHGGVRAAPLLRGLAACGTNERSAMGNQRSVIVGCGLVWSVALVGILAGCAALPPNSFIDPTKVGMFPAEYKEGGVRRVLTPREGSTTLANATEPKP